MREEHGELLFEVGVLLHLLVNRGNKRGQDIIG